MLPRDSGSHAVNSFPDMSPSPSTPVYLDCAATAPVDPRVRVLVARLLDADYGNPGSRHHARGRRARAAVESARDAVAHRAGARRGEVIFTSGATESNNLALLGLEAHGRETGRRHVITSSIEHSAVLGPLDALAARGFEVQRLPIGPSGALDPEELAAALRPDTLCVSVMQVNNETGIRQPTGRICELLEGHPAWLHIDAAQGFGQEPEALRHPRVDMLSVSGHKMYGPQGIGALISRRREGARPPLTPLLLGGGQELGLRAGTLPLALIAGLGEACRIADDEQADRAARRAAYGEALLRGLAPLAPRLHGDPARRAAHIVNLSFPGLAAEEVIDAWRGLVEISDGAACTSHALSCSHVLSAMGLDSEAIEGAVRLSWCHASPAPPTGLMVAALEGARPTPARRGTDG